MINFFWFRRDLRIHDNAGLYHALRSGRPVQPLFIFDKNILDQLEDKNDRRLVFIHRQLKNINEQLKIFGSTLLVIYGTPTDVWKKLSNEYEIENVFANNDYEPYAINRDDEINLLLSEKNTGFQSFKDQVIFEKDEIIKSDGRPYTVYTPYKNQWRKKINDACLKSYETEKYVKNFRKSSFIPIPSLKEIGFNDMKIEFISASPSISVLQNYSKLRDFPAANGTTHCGIHLRFGTVSIRELVRKGFDHSDTWVNELVWREFFMSLLWHFPFITEKAFKPAFEFLPWKNDLTEFEKWCDGITGYPIVDAGMRELNETGYMHNRLRMITAMFLTKYLLIDWKWGEAYFSKKLNDFELANNIGGWQWCAGTGADAAPYFRIFNMDLQTKKFDPQFNYIRKWVPEFQHLSYPKPMIDYSFARKRCIDFFRKFSK